MRVIVDLHNTRKSYSVGRANAEFYIGGSTFLCQFIEPIAFARCAFIFAWWNNTLGGYLDTHEHLRHEVRPEIYLYIIILKSIRVQLTPGSCA